MSVRHKIVLINGAPEVGKSWLVKELRRHYSNSVSIGLNDGLKKVMCDITGFDLFNEETYDIFKKTVFLNGKTGREWMIQISESSKEFHPTVWVERFIDRVELHNRVRRDLILCDSFGFPLEFHAFVASDKVDTLNVYIGNGSPCTLEGDYKQFDGDSRFDLSRHCSVRAVNSTHALAQTLQALSNRGW